LLDVRASLLDPTDLRGIPAIEGGRAVWCPPQFLPGPEAKPGILFFDELNAAPPLVQASLYQLTLDRRVGEYTLPDGWCIIAAGNRAEDASVTFRMPAALANRFIHLNFEVDFDDWRAWATATAVHPTVIAFLSVRRQLLHDMSNTQRGFPTPRSWEMVSDAVKAFGSPKGLDDVILGIVGEGASMEYMSYYAKAISEAAIEKILASPDAAGLPQSLGDQYALITYIASRAKEATVSSAAGRLARRLPVELAVLMLRDMLRLNPKFALNRDYQAFLREHKALLQ
jgi:hypothetical protein